MSYTEALLQEKKRIESKVAVGKQVLYLTRDECMEYGPGIEETIRTVQDTFIEHGHKEYEMPAKIGIHPHDDVFYHAMPAYVPGQMACGCKWIECYPRNPKEHNLPQTSSLLILNEIITGYPMVIMDGTWVTALRTPAVTAVAAELLHKDAETFGMFGCGVQGVGHVKFIGKTLKNLKQIYIYDVFKEAMDSLVEQVKDEVTIEIIKAKSPKEIADNCDVIASATKITKENLAVVKKEWIRPGQTFFPCDLNTFFEASIQRDADKYIVDSRDEHMLFNQMGYFPEGMPEIHCETGELAAGLAAGRENKDEIIVCSNIGMSVFDVAVAKKLFDNAMKNGAGQLLNL